MVENEIQYLRWSEFRQMAPTILRLEIDRLGALIDAADDADFRNALVKARFELKQFVACVASAERDTVEATCAPPLQAALLAVTLVHPTDAAPTTATLAYIIDRLRYVHDRLALIY